MLLINNINAFWLIKFNLTIETESRKNWMTKNENRKKWNLEKINGIHSWFRKYVLLTTLGNRIYIKFITMWALDTMGLNVGLHNILHAIVMRI